MNTKLFNRVVMILQVLLLLTLNIMLLSGMKTTEKAPALEVEPIIEATNYYGGYDNKVITQEISLDWGADDGKDFVPLNVDMDEELQYYCYMLCKGYDIDFTLVMALIAHESNYENECVSRTNDYGLMQINKCNHEWLTEILGVNDFLDPEQNMRAGCFVLRQLFEKYTDTDLVLMAYNMGADNAKKLWDMGIYTSAYAQDVERIQGEYVKEIENGSNL